MLTLLLAPQKSLIAKTGTVETIMVVEAEGK